MAYNIKNPDTERLIRALARAKGMPILAAIDEACRRELDRENLKLSLWDRLQPVIKQVAEAKPTGKPADKAFYDELSGELS